MPDGWEKRNGLDADRANGDGDPDRDRLSSILEYWDNGDPRDPDTDADGLRDGPEVHRWYTRVDRKDQIVGRVNGIGMCPSSTDGCEKQPLFAIQLVLSDRSGTVVTRTRTHLNGRFSFRVAPGRYSIAGQAVDGFDAPSSAELVVTRTQPEPARAYVHYASNNGPGVIGQATLSPTCGGPQRIGEECVGPLEGARIHVEDDNGMIVANTVTGTDGYYAFQLAPGTYRLVAESSGDSLPSPPPPVTFSVAPDDSGPHHIDSNYDTGMR